MKSNKMLFCLAALSLLLSGCTFANSTNGGVNNNSGGGNNETITNKYTVTFLNYDNSLLFRTEVEEGMPAIYLGSTPVRPETSDYRYEFNGWDKDLSAIYANLATTATYEAIKKNGNGGDNNESSGLTRAQKMMYYNGTNGVSGDNHYDTPYGIGRAVNALSDRYIEITNRYNRIFDVDELVNLTWTKTTLRQQDAKVISEDSAAKFQESLAISYGNKTSASAGVEGIFTAGVDTDFGISNDLHINKDTHEIVSKLYQNINGFSIEIEGYNDYRNFRDCLSSRLLEDIVAIENGTMSTDKFFEFYGTHVVMAGYYGGRIECNYHLMFDDSQVTDAMMATYKTKASAGLKSAQASASASSETNFSIKNEIDVNITATSESFTFKGRGGKYISGATEKAFMQNYASWVESFNENEENYSVLVDVPDRALMPIWNLFPTDHSEAANIVLNAFMTEASQCKSEWLEKCAYIYDDDSINDTVNFAGGAGTAESPYLINKPEQLSNVINNMSACYKLISDINLSKFANWEPIGGCYRKTPFNGVFDGNGFEIKNMTRTAQIPEQDSRSFYGFFGKLGEGAVVKNIKFTNVNVVFSGPANNNGGARCFFGIVAGESDSARIENIETTGLIKYDCFTNGETFIAGICGNSVNSEIHNCVNGAEVSGCRYSIVAGGIAAYALGGKIYNCKNKGNVEPIGCCFGGGMSYASGICAVTSETSKIDVYNPINEGVVQAHKVSGWTGNDVRTSETGFVSYWHTRY
ncbi:MAG: hypothetical protein IJQ72_01125 [Bacilli bacterium]|nr:hypothetical protein [Bacilli bacterium]